MFNSVAAVYRLRKGQIYTGVELCNAIFITTNTLMARTTTIFFRDQYNYYRDGAVPHCMVDDLLTTLVWLKNPTRAPDLPRKRIIADCYAAISPPRHLWQRYAKEIERLEKRGDISEDDYYLLRYSPEARKALMDTTLGGSQPFTEGTVAEVLGNARRAVLADVEAALDEQKRATHEEKRKSEATLKKTREESQATVLAEREARLAAESRRQKERQAQLDRIRSVSTRFGRWTANTVGVIVFAILAVGIFLNLFAPGLPLGSWRLPVVAILVVVGVVMVANAYYGSRVVSVKRRLEVEVSSAVERNLRRIVGLQ